MLLRRPCARLSPGTELRSKSIDPGLDSHETGLKVLCGERVRVVNMRPGGGAPEAEQRDLHVFSCSQTCEPSRLANLHRKEKVDQPPPATCSFAVLDRDAGDVFTDRLHVGDPLEVRAAGDIAQGTPVDVASPKERVLMPSCRA
jgi:hypothetical protein